MPAATCPPFLVVRETDGLVLISPFSKRRRGLTPEEAELVETVAGRLAHLPPPPVWIDAQTGNVTPASIAPPQIRRRLIDCAAFEIRNSS